MYSLKNAISTKYIFEEFKKMLFYHYPKIIKELVFSDETTDRMRILKSWPM